MDPDTTLTNLLNLFLRDMGDTQKAPTAEAVREHTEALEQWHHGRGFLPRWPVHLDSGFHFSAMIVGAQATNHEDGARALLLFRSECIALLTRVQVAIEEESRSLYVAAVSNLGGWAGRALDSEDQAPLGAGEHLSPRYHEPNTKGAPEPQGPADLVGHAVRVSGIASDLPDDTVFRCVSTDPHNTAQVILKQAGVTSHEWRVHWGFCKVVTWHNQPADWRCPTCKTTDATVSGNVVTCAHGHQSQ